MPGARAVLAAGSGRTVTLQSPALVVAESAFTMPGRCSAGAPRSRPGWSADRIDLNPLGVASPPTVSVFPKLRRAGRERMSPRAFSPSSRRHCRRPRFRRTCWSAGHQRRPTSPACFVFLEAVRLFPGDNMTCGGNGCRSRPRWSAARELCDLAFPATAPFTNSSTSRDIDAVPVGQWRAAVNEDPSDVSGSASAAASWM